MTRVNPTWPGDHDEASRDSWGAILLAGLGQLGAGINGLGTAADHPASDFTQAANNLSDVADAGSSRANLRIPVLTPAQVVATSNISSRSGQPTIDGYATTNGDVVLLTGQTTASQNGPWQLPATGTGAWTRPKDFPSGAVVKGRSCKVVGGTLYAGTDWALMSTSLVTIDTTAQTWKMVGGGAYVPLSIPASLAQSWASTPVDQSAVIQAAIDAVFAAGGGIVRLPAGWFYCSISPRPRVDLVGSGWSTVLAAMPGQTAPVVDYSTYNAYHCKLADLRIDGNYRHGRTDGLAQGAGRGINLDTTPSTHTDYIYNNDFITASLPTQEDGTPYRFGAFGKWWNDASNVVQRVFVTGVGGDWAIYLGNNARNSTLDLVYVYGCQNGAINAQGTDCIFSNLQLGACGDGVLIGANGQHWTNVKSWYHGVNAGFTGNGDGFRVNLPDDSGYGDVHLVNCESQDNVRDGLRIERGNGVVTRDFISDGDSATAVHLFDAQWCDVDFTVNLSDRAQDAVALTLDGAGAAVPQGNRVRWTANQTGLSSILRGYSYLNGAFDYGNDIQGPPSLQHGLKTATFSATLTPTSGKTLMGGAWTGNVTVAAPAMEDMGGLASGEEVQIVLRDTTGGHTVAFASNYHGVSGFTTTANAYSSFRFTHIGSGIYIVAGQSVNAA